MSCSQTCGAMFVALVNPIFRKLVVKNEFISFCEVRTAGCSQTCGAMFVALVNPIFRKLVVKNEFISFCEVKVKRS